MSASEPARIAEGERVRRAERARIVPLAGAAQTAYRQLLNIAEPDTADREGLAETPLRAAKAWGELTAGYTATPDLKTFDAQGYDEIVAVSGIPFYSLCEHHLLPFHGHAAIAYLPAGRILGLSKFARLVDLYARRLQVQERLTQQIADHLLEALEPVGLIVLVTAEHLCMSMRGVQRPGHTTRTSVVRGLLKDDAAARAEALDLLGGNPR